MTQTHPADHALASAAPLDAVVFEAATLVDPPEPEPGVPPRAMPGARRLVDALVRQGLSVHVLGPRNGHDDAALRAHLVASGLDPGRVSVVAGDATLRRTATSRTLVVTRCPERAAGMAAAGHPTVTIEDRSAHQAVFAWLAGRVGAVRRRDRARRPAGRPGCRRRPRPPAAPHQAARLAGPDRGRVGSSSPASAARRHRRSPGRRPPRCSPATTACTPRACRRGRRR